MSGRADSNYVLREEYPTCRIKSTAIISADCDLQDSRLEDYVFLKHDATCQNSTIGLRSSVGMYSVVRDADVGKYCSISWNVTVGAVNHLLSRLTTHAFPCRTRFGLTDVEGKMPQVRTTVGNDVWIGCNAVVLPGVTVGDGAVIAAGAVVTEDVPPYAVVAGVPGRVLRFRWDEKTVEAVKQLSWWEWDDKTIRENMSLFLSDVDSALLERCMQVKETEGGGHAGM